ncbi:N,N-dimethylformamidase beta subunit family domain-containing protein [Algimonas porphyrae]|uniref:N,N-dimethylformamidase beta subunit-like C-terminal domain-containing protein n=1 Tax=Algimonas porphyrae TaxID=1128113 RepID=A0ABQ5V547_9PROT|nr:N,N-dimethylformamidase beta subunit family domain-containing protein [Algimonas porphyrae]GLQ21968.1 hypothetical protein GCM10007854_29230 [Algimonas porphyrae]
MTFMAKSLLPCFAGLAIIISGCTDSGPSSADVGQSNNGDLAVAVNANSLTDFWNADVVSGADLCNGIREAVWRSQPLSLLEVHNSRETAQDPSCLAALSYMKLNDRIPTVEADIQLIGDLVHAHTAGFKAAADIIALTEPGTGSWMTGLVDPQRLADRGPFMDQFRTATASTEVRVLEARDNGDMAAERDALLPYAHAGHARAMMDLGMIHYLEAGHLGRDAIASYRAAAFLGEDRAFWSLGALALREYAAGRDMIAPEGTLEPGAILAFAKDNFSAAHMAGRSDALDYLSRIAQVEQAGGVLDADMLDLFSNVQPVGRTFWQADDVFRISTSVLDPILNRSSMVDTSAYPDVRVRFAYDTDKRASDQTYIAGYEIWHVDDAVRRLDSVTFEDGLQTVPVSACDSWYDMDACEFSAGLRLTLSDTVVEAMDSGLVVLELHGPAGLTYAPIPLFPDSDRISRRVEAVDNVLVYPDLTFQAYNVAFGGSLYIEPRGNEIYAVDIDRPEDLSVKNSHHNYRSALVIGQRLAELGQTVLHVPQSYLIDRPDLLDEAETLTIVGHDEYWDPNIKAAMERYVDTGGDMLLLSGNTAWFYANMLDRTMGINKGSEPVSDDPFNLGFDYAGSGVNLYFPRENRIEHMTGMSYETGGYSLRYFLSDDAAAERGITQDQIRASGPLYALAPDHPVFEGLDLQPDAPFCRSLSLLQWEIDALPLIGPNKDLHLQWSVSANRETTPLAAGYGFNPNFPAVNARPFPGLLHYSAVLGESRYGDGRILTLGSMGAYGLVRHPDTKCRAFADNVLTYFQD